MRKLRKFLKRALAIVLVVTIFTSAQLQVQAVTVSDYQRMYASNTSSQSGSSTSSPEEKSLAEQAQDSIDEASDYAEFGMGFVTDEFSSALDEQKNLFTDEGGYFDDIMKSIKKGSKLESAWKTGLNIIEGAGMVLNIADEMQNCADVMDLQGRTVGTQSLEVLMLTLQFAVTALSMFSIIGWPLGLILATVINLLLNYIRSGAFDDEIDNWKEKNGGEFSDTFRKNFFYPLPNGNNVYKPNIYIYSEESKDVTVTFDREDLLTTTIPEYVDQWKVTTGEDGKLLDENGESYDYLFYESIADSSIFQTEEGYRIPADQRDETFRSILKNLNFSDQEIEDFVEFWDVKLEDGVDYVMYPQTTEKVDEAMPVNVKPAPESISRIWFAFDVDNGSQIKEPEGYELDRSGDYYVIEWGGLILGE